MLYLKEYWCDYIRTTEEYSEQPLKTKTLEIRSCVWSSSGYMVNWMFSTLCYIRKKKIIMPFFFFSCGVQFGLGIFSLNCSSLTVTWMELGCFAFFKDLWCLITFQQTISQATAAKYPRTVFLASGSTTVRPAGQVGRMLQSQTHTSVQSIKVVDWVNIFHWWRFLSRDVI